MRTLYNPENMSRCRDPTPTPPIFNPSPTQTEADGRLPINLWEKQLSTGTKKWH